MSPSMGNKPPTHRNFKPWLASHIPDVLKEEVSVPLGTDPVLVLWYSFGV